MGKSTATGKPNRGCQGRGEKEKLREVTASMAFLFPRDENVLGLDGGDSGMTPTLLNIAHFKKANSVVGE